MTRLLKGGLSLLALLVLLVACYNFLIPVGSLAFCLQFAGAAVIFWLGADKIGECARAYLFRSDEPAGDFLIGLGVFTLVLNFWTLAIDSLAPLTFLFLGAAAWALFTRIKKGRTGVEPSHFLLLPLILLLAWHKLGTGFLHFPDDFDSGLLHVTIPKIWLKNHHVEPLPYVRCPFLGQFTHLIYYFVLNAVGGDDNFLKIVNLCAFVSFFKLCKRTSAAYPSLGLAPFLIPVMMILTPTTREYWVSTNLDALFSTYLFGGFLLLFYGVLRKSTPLLLLAALLLGFSGGQKHFGLMMSAPLLAGCYASAGWLLLKSTKRWLPPLKMIGLGLTAFLVGSLSFYIHNVFAGAHILFPFFGDLKNNYGWSETETKYFIGNNITHWGHNKNFAGFFSLPWDFLRYNGEYQYNLINQPSDYVYSAIFLMAFAAFALSLPLWIKRKTSWEPALFSLLNLSLLFSWYRGSQVVRYLMPNIAISMVIFFFALSQLRSLALPRKLTIVLIALLSVVIFQEMKNLEFKETPIPYSAERREAEFQRLYPDLHPAIAFYRAQAPQGRLLFIGNMSYLQHMTDLSFCGDWFGMCRFDDFVELFKTTPPVMQFKPMKEMKAELKQFGIRWILVDWKNFSDHQVPASLAQATHDPECYSSKGRFGTIEIIKISEECLN